MRTDGDRGDIILGWLTKITVILAVLGVLGFDALSLGAARFQAEDRALTAARVAVASYRTDPNVQKAYDAALAEVAPDGDTLDADTFTVAPDGSVTLRLRKVVPTLVLQEIPPLRRFTTVLSTVTATPAP